MAGIPTPPSRKLRIFALDPSLGSSLKTYELRTDTINVRFEHGIDGHSTLKPGPVGEYLEVVDVDPASNLFYAPVDLDDRRILATDGLAPSEGNPQFQQQMVYAVAMRTIEIFEEALGRYVLWAPRQPAAGAKDRSWIYVQRLRLYPHALRAKNAFYSPDRRAILFGYFPSEASEDAVTPGGSMVFSCLSSDVIAHEMTHAILDGAARGYREDSNPDVLAFHEGFADIVALFEHFLYPDLVKSEIARARGTSAMDLLSGLAKQFGESTQRGGPLRDYSKFPDTFSYRKTFEVHDRGSILVKAVYDAFIAIVERRSTGLIELATGGSGVLRPGALHPTLVDRLANETMRAAGHVLRMCVRAIDYCPPVDIDFGTYLRALITADLEQVDEDRFNYRTAFLESFRRWGLLPCNLRTVSVETLTWQHPKAKPTRLLPKGQAAGTRIELLRRPAWLGPLVAKLEIDWAGEMPRERVFKLSQRRLAQVHYRLTALMLKHPTLAEELGLKSGLPKYVSDLTDPNYGKVDDAWVKAHPNRTNFQVASVRAARRVRPDGKRSEEIVVVIQQKEPKTLSTGEIIWFRGGVTVVIDPQPKDRSEPEILYAITRSMNDEARLKAEIEYREGDRGAGLRRAYFGRALDGLEPFALLHGGEEVDA